MGKGSATPWVVGAFVLALLMGAGAWFLGISPQLERASDDDQQARPRRRGPTSCGSSWLG